MKYFSGSSMVLGLALLLAAAGHLQAATLLVPGLETAQKT